jgi:hypothetical protein
MFVRFRENGHRLCLSLIETRRADGKVRHEHIGSLGSLEMPQTMAGRIVFWQRLHERLARLSNRLSGEAHVKVLTAIHARIPMVTPDEQRTLQLENAKADAEFWEGLHGAQSGTVEDHKRLAATVAASIAKGETAAADAAANAKAARERAERIERGENVEGGLHERWTRERVEAELIKGGLTRSDLRHCEDLAELHGIFRRALGEKGAEAQWEKMVRKFIDEHDRSDRAFVRKLLDEWFAR